MELDICRGSAPPPCTRPLAGRSLAEVGPDAAPRPGASAPSASTAFRRASPRADTPLGTSVCLARPAPARETASAPAPGWILNSRSPLPASPERQQPPAVVSINPPSACPSFATGCQRAESSVHGRTGIEDHGCRHRRDERHDFGIRWSCAVMMGGHRKRSVDVAVDPLSWSATRLGRKSPAQHLPGAEQYRSGLFGSATPRRFNQLPPRECSATNHWTTGNRTPDPDASRCQHSRGRCCAAPSSCTEPRIFLVHPFWCIDGVWHALTWISTTRLAQRS